MSAPSDRRGFLRALAGLPLIGGGVTLIGNPTAAAVPLTGELLDTYDTWLFYERRYLKHERSGGLDGDDCWDRNWVMVPRAFVKDEYQDSPGDIVKWGNPGIAFHGNGRAAPAAFRAAVVLSAAGCSWRRQGDR